MKECNFYELENRNYLCVRMVKTISGFWISSHIMAKFSKLHSSAEEVVNFIRDCLEPEMDERVPDPKDWKSFQKDFLQRSGLKSMRELEKTTTKLCAIELKSDTMAFIPHKKAVKPDKGYIELQEKKITKKYNEDNLAIFDALQTALSNCD